MCGVAGWVDFERNLLEERATAQKMTDTMARRGPDAQGLWLGQHVALGHRRLAVLDLAGGSQPMVLTEAGDPTAVIIYTGEVYNFAELRQELISLGHTFHTNSDTEVVLQAWQAWGERFVERLNGMYAFAIWDVAQQQLLLVRDRLGVKPLYYYPIPGGVLFGSEPKAILSNPLAKAVVDREGLCEMLTLSKTPGHAIFRGMRELRPGHTLKVWRGGHRETSYWQLTARPHTDDQATTVRTIRELLEDIVTRQLVCDVPRCALLSGGLDSSLLAALAQKQLLAQGAGPLRTFSVDFVDSALHFKAQQFLPSRDAPFVAEMVRHLGTDHTDIVISAAELADPAVRSAVLAARDLPPALGDLDLSLYLLFREVRKHSTVALSGESADEVFGGYFWFHDPELVAAPTFPWLSIMWRASQKMTMPTMPLDAQLLARLDLGGYSQSRYQEALTQVPHLDGEQGQERRMREVFYLHLTRWLQVMLDRKDRTSMANGLEVRVPFCDHRLVEYVFNTPFAMKVFDGHEKSLLRAAVADLLPQSVLQRRKSPYPTSQDPAYGLALFHSIDRIIEQGTSPVLPLLDIPRVRAMTQNKALLEIPLGRLAAEHILNLDCWLTQNRVEVVD